MNEDLKNQLMSMLGSLAEGVKTGASWLGKEIPPLIAEKIALGRIWETLLLVVALASMGVAFYASHRCHVHNRDGTYSENIDYGLCCFLWGAVALLLFIVAVAQSYIVTMVWFAPRLYIVEWLISLTKA